MTNTIGLPSSDYIVFGSVFEECEGSCRELFLLTSDHLFRDAGNPAEEEVRFIAEPLSDEEYSLATFIYEVPDMILTNSVEEEDMHNIIADADKIIFGNYKGYTFELKYDLIISERNPELYDFTEKLRSVVKVIR